MPNTIDPMRADAAPEFISTISKGKMTCQWLDEEFERTISERPSLTIVQTPGTYAALIKAAEGTPHMKDELYSDMAMVLTTRYAWPEGMFYGMFLKSYGDTLRHPKVHAFPAIRDTKVPYGSDVCSVPLVAVHKATGISLHELMAAVCTGELRFHFQTAKRTKRYVGIHLRDALLLTGHLS